MTSVFPRAVLDQLAWRPRVPMTPLGPSGLPHDLERFRPVEREEVQVVAASRIEMPVMLRASPMDRGGLHTWLATRKAESDKKREEEEVASNPWLAKRSQPERKKEEAAGTKQSSSRLASPVCEKMASSVQGSVKEKLRQDLLKAWSGGEKAAVEPRRLPEPSVPVGASWCQLEGDLARTNLEKIHPMGRMRAEMQAAAQRSWLARPDVKVQRKEEESSKAEESKETRAMALRKSLLSAWGSQEPEVEVTKKMNEVSLSAPAAPNSSTTVNVVKPSALPSGCGRPLLAAWTSGQCPSKEPSIKEPSIKETRRCLLSSWTSGTSSDASSLEIVENQDANISMDDAASEASIVTLDTVTDDSDDFDDFSDMKHELCQWISQ